MVYCIQGEHANHYTTDAVHLRFQEVIIMYYTGNNHKCFKPLGKNTS
jgi:hypothetical protein